MNPIRAWQWQRMVRRRQRLGLTGCQHSMPGPAAAIHRVPMLAVDLETTGLNPSQSTIVAIGWVPIDQGELRLQGADERLVREAGSVGESATIHGVRDCDLSRGESLAQALEAFLTAAAGRVLVAHHAGFDVGFLQAACQRTCGERPAFLAIDTLAWARRRAERQGQALAHGAFRLGALRQRLGLPARHAHAALSDALSCGELALAMMAGSGARLGDVARWWP